LVKDILIELNEENNIMEKPLWFKLLDYWV
jgi:hypothetical protein